MPSAFRRAGVDAPPRSAVIGGSSHRRAPLVGAFRESIVDLNPGGIIAWLLVGLIAGWLAGQFMKGGGYGLIGDIIMGIIGAFVGGLLFSFLLPGSSVGLLGSIVVAFIGAVVLIALVGALPGRSPVWEQPLACHKRHLLRVPLA